MRTETTRKQYERLSERYASDVNAAEFALLEPHLPPAKRLGRPRTTDLREVINAFFTCSRRAASGACCPKIFRPGAQCTAISRPGAKTALGAASITPFTRRRASARDVTV